MSGFSKQEIKEMKKMFFDEGVESIAQLEKKFQLLESDRENKTPLVEIYRIIHSFKGMAGTIGLQEFEKFFHTYESFISSIQEDKIKLTKEVIDLFFSSLDIIESGLNMTKSNKSLENYFDPFLQKLMKIRTGDVDDEELQKKMRMKNLFEEYGLDDFSENTLDLKDKSKKVYLIDITLESNIRLKVARLFVIIRLLSSLGKIHQTVPEFYDLLEGRFDDQFQIMFQSKKDSKEIKNAVFDSGEIAKVTVDEISIEKAKSLLSPKKEEAVIIEQDDEPIQDLGSTVNTVKVSHTDLDKLMEYFGELLIRSKQLENLLSNTGNNSINEIVFEMQNYMFNLQDIVLQIQMVPISIAFRIFPRMVRNLAIRQKKKIQFIVKHNDVKVDRKVLNDLNDILNHVIRNAISHGIETEEERKSADKSSEGIIKIDIAVDNSVLTIKITDDGRGIDSEKIKKLAVERGLFTESEINRMSDWEIVNIIFQPNFSTKEVADNISGRGLGLNIVRQKVELLGGSIHIETMKNLGSTFLIQLPITRTLIRALLIRSGTQVFSIPLEDIKELMEVSKDDITEINEQSYLFIPEHNQSVRVYYLNKIFQLDKKQNNKEIDKVKLVHISKGSRNFALVVDDFIREDEIVIKKIESVVKEIKGISGAAILDDGTVSLIIDSFTIIN